MKFYVHIFIFIISLLIISCGGIRAKKAQDELSIPLSEQLHLISSQEELFLKGRPGGPMVTVNKPIKGIDLQRYTTFDKSVVMLTNIPDYMADEYSNVVHRLVVDMSKQYEFTLVDHRGSQAGIACVLAPFLAEGKMAFELLVIVFDREKSNIIMNESPTIRGLPVALKAAVWYAVARFYPEGDLVLERGPADREISMTLQRLFNGVFSKFMMRDLDEHFSSQIFEKQNQLQAARQELNRLNIPWGVDEFLDRAKQGNTSGVELFLSAGMDPNAEDKEGRTALMWAAEFDHIDIAQALLQKGAIIDAKSVSDSTALWLAVKEGHTGIVKLFLDKGANVNAKNALGLTALIGATMGGHTDTVQALLNTNADVNVKDKDGLTALDYASQRGYTDIVQLLDKTRTSILGESSNEKNTLLSMDELIAHARLGDTHAVESMLDAGIDPNATGKDGLTALMGAAMRGQIDTVQALLARGADVHAKNIRGSTALTLTAIAGHTAIVRLLLDKGADVNAKNTFGGTALMGAARLGQTDVMRVLIEKGAKVNVADKEDKTALMWAAAGGLTETVKILLDKGAAVNAINQYGSTALIVAASNGHTSIARYLLENNADVNVKDKDGRTALMWAAINGYLTIVRDLLARGAEMHSKDNRGFTALSYASQWKHPDIINLLKGAGANE